MSLTEEDGEDTLSVYLNKSLEKLEIVPEKKMKMERRTDDVNYCKYKSAIESNPFLLEFHKKRNNISSSNSNVDVNKIFGPKCTCDRKLRRKKEYEHDLKSTTKFKSKSNTKTILKEPLLKVLGKCVHEKQLLYKKTHKITPTLSSSSSSSSTTTNNNNNNDLDNMLDKNETDDILDFRILANKYSSLSISQQPSTTALESTVEVFNRLSQYTDHRSSSIPSTSTATTSTKSLSVVDQSYERGERSQNANNRNTSSSCSQQARLNLTGIATQSSCDITIDELACYFETFVHIPKKMSSMAEMMYI